MIPNQESVLQSLEKAYVLVILALEKAGKERVREDVELVRTKEREQSIYRSMRNIECDLCFVIDRIKEGKKYDYEVESAIAKLQYGLLGEE